MKRAAIWAAVSTKRQAQEDMASLPTQVEAARQVIAEKGWVEVHEPLVVDGHSRQFQSWEQAKANVPAFRRLWRLVYDGGLDVLLVRDADRIGRTVGLVSQVVGTMMDRGIEVFGVRRRRVLDSKILMAVEAAIADEETKRTSSRRETTIARNVAAGKHVSQVPFGYDLVPVKVGGRWTKEVQVVDADAELVRRAFVEYVAGRPLRPLARELGLSTKGLRGVLANPFYQGKVRLQRWTWETDEHGRKRRTGRAEGEGSLIEADGNHDAIVDQDLWDKAQVEAARRAAENPRYPHTRYTVTGLSACGYCGGLMMVHSTGGRNYRYLVCREEGCRRPDGRRNRIRYEMIEVAVDRMLRSELPSAREIMDLAFPGGGLDEARASAEAEVRSLARLVGGLERKAARWTDAFEDGDLEAAEFGVRSRAAEEKVKAAKTELAAAEARLAALPTKTELTERAEEFATEAIRLADRLSTTDAEEAVEIKGRLKKAGVRVLVYQEGAMAALAWPAGVLWS